MRSRLFSELAGRFMALRMRALACWRHVKVRQDLAFGHQWQQIMTLGIRIHVARPTQMPIRPVPCNSSSSLRLDRTPAEESGAAFTSTP